MNREIPHPPIDTESEEFDDSPNAERNKKLRDVREELKAQSRNRPEETEKQKRIRENANAFLERLNKIPPKKKPGDEPEQQKMFQ